MRIFTLNAFYVYPTCDIVHIQVVFSFSPKRLEHILREVPDDGAISGFIISGNALEVEGRKNCPSRNPTGRYHAL